MTSADYGRDQRVIELRLARLEEGLGQVLGEIRALRDESIQRRAAWKTVALISSLVTGGMIGAVRLFAEFWPLMGN